jgi:hypothetical protein
VSEVGVSNDVPIARGRGVVPGYFVVAEDHEQGVFVVSDGWATASVFVEPLSPTAPSGEGAVIDGAYAHLHSRHTGWRHWGADQRARRGACCHSKTACRCGALFRGRIIMGGVTEPGVVVAIESNAVWVEADRSAACGRCAARAGCGQGALSALLAARARVE